MAHLQLNQYVAACGIVILLRLLYLKIKPSLPFPPGPKPLPVIENMLDFPRSKSWETFAKWGKSYGDVVHLHALGQSYIILNSLQAINDLFEKRSYIYSGRPHRTMINDLMGLGESTTMMTYGNLWNKHRTMYHQQLNPTAIKEFQPQQVATARELLRSILENPQGYRLHIRQMSAQIVMNIAYGYNAAVTEDPFIELAEQVALRFIRAIRPGEFLVDLMPILKYIPEWIPGAGFQKFARESRKIWYDAKELPFENVKMRLAEGTAAPSFVANTLSEIAEGATDDCSQTESEEILKVVAGNLYSAGTDTTAASIHTFVLAMVLYPEVQKIARVELDSVVGTERLPEFGDRPHMPYMEAIVKEVLRWHPVTPNALPHSLTEDDTYRGYHIPKGAIVIGNAWAILHDPEMYPDPSKFRPERFLTNEEGGDKRDPVATGAFGYGRRICPGHHLAEATIWIAASSLLATFEITSAKDEYGHGIDVRYALDPPPNILVHPRPFPCTTFNPRCARMKELVMETSP